MRRKEADTTRFTVRWSRRATAAATAGIRLMVMGGMKEEGKLNSVMPKLYSP